VTKPIDHGVPIEGPPLGEVFVVWIAWKKGGYQEDKSSAIIYRILGTQHGGEIMWKVLESFKSEYGTTKEELIKNGWRIRRALLVI